jgi:serine/threonine protein kinase
MPDSKIDIALLIDALQGARDLLGASRELPKCDACGAQNSAVAVFCSACGGPLISPCPGCGHRCRIRDRHCQACGRELVEKEVLESIGRLKAAEDIVNSDPLRAFDDLQKLSENRAVHYRARRQGQDRFLKVAEKDLSRNLLRNEAGALKGFEHENVIRLIEHREHRDRTLLELEWVEAEALRFPLSIGHLIHLMHGVARGLAAIHERAVVHCDVKPDNILIRKDNGNPVLIDFEAAQHPGGHRVSGYTPMFAAPEQVFGDRIDARSDVYAFGMTLYLLFFYDRLPSIIDPESRSQREFEKILKAKVRRSRHYLADATMIGGFEAKAVPEPEEDLESFTGGLSHVKLPIRAASNEDEVLGAKYFFAGELQRIADVNRRLDLTRDILAIIADCTEVDPDRRPFDGSALVARMSVLAEAVGRESS